MLAGQALKRILRENPDLKIEQVEITSDPGRTWRDGVRMIPAIKMGEEILSGLILSANSISNFIKQKRNN